MSRTVPLSYGAVIDSHVNSNFLVNAATTTGLTFGVKAGEIINGVLVTAVGAGTIALADDTVDQLVFISAGVLALGSGDFLLYEVTTASGVITVINDKRAAYP
jgi:hypothetical protein